MKAVVQRVKSARLEVEGKMVSEIKKGLVVFFCAEQKDVSDATKKAEFLAKKIYNLRVFEDEAGKMNLSLDSVKGEILAVSQFTLCGDVSHGNRPSFFSAMSPDCAQKVYDGFCKNLRSFGVTVAEGIFGADMQITQVNDGPVTIWYDI